MSGSHFSNTGDKPNGFSLMRKPSSAIEKAAPGAKRIVFGMVADTLALAKQTKTPKSRGLLLIVDDEEWVRDCLRVIFNDEYDLLIAEDGATAIELAKQHDVDVTVTNIHMARMDGLELLKRLKLLKPDIKVIILTGHEDAEFIRQALRLGAFDYLTKPSDPETIRSAVRTAMHLGQGDNSSREVLNKSEAGTPPVNHGDNPRIVFAFSNHTLLQSDISLVIKNKFKNSVVLTFDDSEKAWHELSQTNPGLLITDDDMLEQGGGEILRHLLDRKSTYPIIVVCRFGHQGSMPEHECKSRGLNVQFLYFEDYDSATRATIAEELELAWENQRAVDESDAEANFQNFIVNDARGVNGFKRHFLRKAAKLGHTEAMYRCGMDFQSGDGFSMDRESAFYWLKKAAERGHADAEFWIATYYMSGESFLPQNLSEAYKWFKLAADHKNKDMFWAEKHAALFSARLSAKMTSEQLQEGERRYREFQSSQK